LLITKWATFAVSRKRLEHVGAHPEITSDPERIRSADKVILPGVGAFCDAIRELQSRQLVEPLRDCIASGKPFLGNLPRPAIALREKL
jgi:glutamine amidotransferase